MTSFTSSDFESQKKFFLDNGFLVVKNLISYEEADYYYFLSKKIADKNFSAILNPDRLSFLVSQCLHLFDSANSLTEKTESFDELYDIASHFRKLAEKNKCIRILENLKEREICLLMSQMLFKEANSKYASQAWSPHQDNSYPLNPNGQYITTNIFFKDADPDNGSLYVFAGSQKDGLKKFDSQTSYRETKGNPGNLSQFNPENYKKIDLFFEKGDMVVLDGNLIHGSYGNDTNRSRPLYSASFISFGEPFVPGRNASRRIFKDNS